MVPLRFVGTPDDTKAENHWVAPDPPQEEKTMQVSLEVPVEAEAAAIARDVARAFAAVP